VDRDLHQDKQESACITVPRGARVKEATVRKLKYFSLVALILFLLAIPAAAQKSSRSNKGAAAKGDTRADLVQSQNKKKDKDKDPAPDNDRNKGKHKGETKGKHNAKGHRH